LAYIIELPTFSDHRGALTVLEKVLPFTVVRAYWMVDLKEKRGGHRHRETWQAMVCLQGACQVNIKNKTETYFLLDNPNQLLILPPEDWHEMNQFENNPVLLVFASKVFDKNDYLNDAIGI